MVLLLSNHGCVVLACSLVGCAQLPQYRRASTLREKLQYAIKSKAGFDFS